MCGICGSVGYTEGDVLVQVMTRAMMHRGPDSDGFLSAGPISLGMRRLVIIDLTTGDQPVFNEERTISSLLEITRTWGKAKEIIVVNDGSKDKTLQAVRQFKRQIITISRKQNKGKGYSMAEGVRCSTGDVIMFMDGDVVGLTHRDLNAMTDPVIKKQKDMVIGVTNCSKIGDITPFDKINGERVLLRKNIIEHLKEFHEVGNGVEFVINHIHRKKRVLTIQLPHVYILSKVEKAAVPEAMKQYIVEAGQFLKAIIQIQAKELTPTARQALITAQSYIKRALEYFQ